MDLLKGLLIDDEINILKNLKAVVPWRTLGVQIIGMAKNGEEALRMFHDYHPDLILCDIRMPKMDGIDFIQEIRYDKKDCEIFMITGFKDFEYMQSSIRCGVRDYILKPINYDELIETIRETVREIRQRYQKKNQELNRLKNITNLAFEKILHDALMGYTPNLPWVWNEDDSHSKKGYYLIVVDFDYHDWRKHLNEDRRQLNAKVKSVLKQSMKSYQITYSVLQMRDREWCLLVEDNKGREAFIQSCGKKLKQDLQDNIYLSTKVGIYHHPIAIDDLQHTYKVIQRDLQLSLTKTNKQPVIIDDSSDIKLNDREIDYFLWDKIEAIVNGVKRGSLKETEEALQNLKVDLNGLTEESFVHIEKLLVYLTLHLLREMKELQLLDDDDETTIWEILRNRLNNEDLLSVIQDLVNQSLSNFSNKRKSETLMIQAKDYIEQHLSEDFGISELADFLDISPSYFSLLFKQHFDETFVEYLTRERMEKAKTLLTVSDQSIAKISNQLGYADRRYFSKVFHKYCGVLPSDYRKHKA